MKKKKNLGLIILITILIVAAITSIFFVSNVGKATKALDSEDKATSTYLPDTTQLTEFNIPTKEPLDTTSISQTFKENTEIDLKLDKPINALSVTGNATLLSEAGLIRIILVDSEKHEYLVYETSSLLSINSKEINFVNACEETCVLDKSITPVSIKIQVEDAILDIFSINTLPEDKSFTEIKDNIKNYKIQILESQNQAKIEKYNSAQKSWTAGETSVSNLSYEEQKRLFTREDGTIPEYLPNLQGFLYYKGGIFTLKETKEQQAKSQDNTTPYTPPEIGQENIILPNSWDWRNVHGENWMTPIKNQGNAGTCLSFATVGSLESQINLYYNQHLNLNLSEQMLSDCGPHPYPNSSWDEFLSTGCISFDCKLKYDGVADESCDPYVERAPYFDTYCTNDYICNNWNERVWLSNPITTTEIYNPNTEDWVFQLSEKELEAKIIKNGPLNSGIVQWGHAMVLIGYKNQNLEETGEWNMSGICDSICLNGQCVSIFCNSNPNETIIGSYNIGSENNVYWLQPGIKTYLCNPADNNQSQWIVINDEACEESQISINGECIDGANNSFSDGFRTCTANNNQIYEYIINTGNYFWIFKNSWGEGWGENGYFNYGGDIEDLTSFSEYSSTITPPTDTAYWPTGFDNTINCEDKDGDKYCNWGISEQKPSTCPSFCNARKDCDDSNPDLLDFISETNLNCRYKYTTQQ